MGEWIIGAFINLIGSVAINFGTNLLKLGHDQRERLSMLANDESNRVIVKPIIYFQTWRVGALFFTLGNCLNFISFGYAAQLIADSNTERTLLVLLAFLCMSLLAALGSVQFVSNIAFSYFVLKKMVTVKVVTATAFIVIGNVFLVSFGNHQSPVYTPEQLTEKFSNIVFLVYCLVLLLMVCVTQYIYSIDSRKGEDLSSNKSDVSPYWRILLPFSYATVSGAVGSCSVLFAKSLSNLLRLAWSNGYQLHSWFTYSMLLLFLSTAGFWMKRLNDGLSLFDAILIVPMFQIAWTLFSICTGFMYFQEYQVFDELRITMFVLGMAFVFIGISLLAPDDSKGAQLKDSLSSSAQIIATDVNRLGSSTKLEVSPRDTESNWHVMRRHANYYIAKAKAAGALFLGLGEESIGSSSVLAMPMLSSRTTGFRRTIVEQTNFELIEESSWSESVSLLIADDEDDGDTRAA